MQTLISYVSIAFFSILGFSAAANHSHEYNPHLASQASTVSASADTHLGSFIRNDNQWHSNVLYQANIPGRFNHVYLEQNRLTYQLYDDSVIEDFHKFVDEKQEINVKGHSYHVNFKNANKARLLQEDVHAEKLNYFIGNDRSKWASCVPMSDRIVYDDLYNGIDLHLFKKYTDLKYEFVIAPRANPEDIVLEYEGISSIKIVKGKLVIETSVGIVTELKPYTYQIINGKKNTVACDYQLQGNELTFALPDGYDKNYPLIIDPIVVAATLSGHNIDSSAGVFGHTAAFDTEGNIYTGGRVYGAGYVTSTGAFDLTFNGGSYDMGFLKYNSTGTQMVYGTYVGGNDSDNPHSIITDFSQRLYVYGSSRSSDFPTTPGAFQQQIGGQTDIVAFVLDTDGSQLVGSTFIGGSQHDGLNQSVASPCYGDTYRGEIIIDAQNNVYIASGSKSDDFPIANGFNNTFNPGGGGIAQDGVVIKMSSDLSAMYWSTYMSSSGSDFCTGLRLDDEGNVIVTGFMGKGDFQTTPGTIMPTFPGGDQSAFISKIQKDGSALLLSTFWGTASSDRGYFIDLDESNNVHVYGYTQGTINVTPGTYYNELGSPQFITGFTPDLTNVIYSTVIGKGPGGAGFDYSNSDIDFVPVAFMVDKCNAIYFSGYGAADGLPITDGNFWSEGNSFYLGVLNETVTDLLFGTYYGRSNHVDGGTSRFDKSGTVYQAVCSCTNSGDHAMVTNSDAFEPDMPNGIGGGGTCDVGVFKIDFEVPTVTAAGVIFKAGTNLVSSSGCAPFDVDFRYTGADAESFYWNFGDGFDSTEENPSHTFQDAGSYTVYLVAESLTTCNQLDTVFLYVDVLDDTPITRDTSFCEGVNSIFLDASVQNATYTWQNGFSGSTYVVNEPGIYWVDIDIGECARRDSFIVNPPVDINLDLGSTISACDVNIFNLDGTTDNVSSYLWSNGETTPSITVDNSQEGDYALTVTDLSGCQHTDNVTVLFGTTPQVDLGLDVTLCSDVEYTADVSVSNSNVTYTWSNGNTSPTFSTTAAGTYSVVLSDDGCEASDEVVVTYHPVFTFNENITPIACHNDCNGSIEINGQGGVGIVNLIWNDGGTASTISDLCPDTYSITATDEAGCTVTEEYILTDPNTLEITPTAQDLACAGDFSGIISGTSTTGGVPPYSYSLDNQNFTENPNFEGLAAGDYTLYLLDDVNCLVTTELTITEPPEFFVYAGEDQSIQLGETTNLNGAVIPDFGQTIEWSPPTYLDCTDCLDTGTRPVNTITYTLTATDPDTGCYREDEVTIEVIKIRRAYIPNAFSPNDDGINDEVSVFAHIGVERVLEFKIFDRWGSMIFENKDFIPNKPGYGWDGTYKGKPVDPAVFVYYAKVLYLDGETGLLKGDITVFR